MTIIFGYLIIICIFRLILIEKEYNNLFLFCSIGILFVISSTRTIWYGSDVIRYINIYQDLTYIDFPSLIESSIGGDMKDPVFYLSSKLISLTGANYRIWLSVISGVFIYSVSRIIKIHSPYPFISVVALISLGYFSFSMTGLRQTIAISIILFSYSFIRERKLLQFIICVILASLFHSSALIFLISYPISFNKIDWKNILILVFAFLILFISPTFIRSLISLFSWNDTLANYAFRETTLTLSGFIIQFFIFIFYMVFINNILTNNHKDIILFNISFVGLFFQLFATEIAEFFRISMYFSIFNIILIPIAIKSIKNTNLRRFVYYTVLCALIAYIAWSSAFAGLDFFWNDTVTYLR